LDTEQYESGSDVANMLTKLYLENKIPVREDRILNLATYVDCKADLIDHLSTDFFYKSLFFVSLALLRK